MRKFAPLAVAALLITLAFARRGGDALARAAATEFTAKSITASCTRQQVSPITGASPAVTYTVSLAKPNRARLDMPEELTVADGTTITVYDKASRTYMQKPQTDRELQSLFACNELSLFGSFFDLGYYDRARCGKVGKRSRKGIVYHVAEGRIDRDAAAFYVDPADNLPKIAEFTPAGTAETETTVVSIGKIAVGVEQPGDLYTFEAPSGSSEITAADLRRANAFVAPPTFNTKALATWHMYQSDERGNFPNDGKDFCAPTAAANGLIYLGLNGYPKLFQGDEPAALKLIGTLASTDYMGTNPPEGTGDSQVIRGLLKFIGQRGYAVQSTQYRGWRPLDWAATQYRASGTIDLDWVKHGIAAPNSLVLLHVGWFEPDGGGNWTRVQGHWVTATGYGSNGSEVDPDLFLVANPNVRVANPPTDPMARLQLDTVKMTPMGSGILSTRRGDYRGLPIPAKGQYRVSGKGLSIRKPGRIGVLDGVIVMVLRPAK